MRQGFRGRGKRAAYDEALRDAVKTLTEFRNVCKRPLIAFSGGKDSIVLAHISKMFDLTEAVRDNALSFYRVEDQVIRNVVPALGIRVKHVDRLGRSFPFNRRDYLFPDTAGQAKFYRLAQVATVKHHAMRRQHDGVLYGRRRQENVVRAPIYQTVDGLWSGNPLINWTHEQVWTYIEDNGLPFPDIYETEVGPVDGATPWNLISPEKYSWHPYVFIRNYCPNTWAEIVQMEPLVAASVQAADA